ncbi:MULTISPECIES: alpha,alpha-trehalose-phosphate synthase (UDP-forming) [Aminobacterium]|jgi:trehalose 6-phosphate synthase|uniref:alpha,alpha-trehalose-phosphate synthase (UDP-forming) n=1 Tax=Aminobacterium TaxID=81466 RepID=UPI00257FEB8C|nr:MULTISPECIES: trehalose-6-phosphate synthase [unclassified Aminobacterium]
MDKWVGKRVVVVSNRLPVVLRKNREEWVVDPGAGGLVTALSPVLRSRGGLWIGWTGCKEEIGSEKLRYILEPVSRRSGFQIIGVQLEELEIEGYYHGFSNSVLWPLFHDLETKCSFSPHFWELYLQVNHKFAKIVAENTRPEDLIWVNDYQLIPLAESFKKIGVKRQCVFFLHIPFPPPDVFMKLPWRVAIMEELQQYTFLCFQTHRDRKNFINSMKILYPSSHIEGRGMLVSLNTGIHQMKIGNLPASIDYKAFCDLSKRKKVVDRALKVRQAAGGRHLFLGVDRLDYTKGVPEKLRAFSRALEKYSTLQDKIMLLQVLVPSREGIYEYRNLREEIEELVRVVNRRFSTDIWTPITYQYTSVSQEELAALYHATDTALVTSLKDGMNLVCKEYCACHSSNGGSLILSEFAGAACQMRKGALLVNPYDVEGVADTIYYAVIMSLCERKSRMTILKNNLRKHDVYWWGEKFLLGAWGDF